jgi:hypothetical protein
MTQAMEGNSKNKTGLIFGVVAGVIYMLILLVRYKFYGNNPQELGIISAAGFAVMIILFFLSAYTRKKQLDGYADIKELFGTVFVVIIIAEICFSAFNFFYLKYIDPEYLNRFRAGTMQWMEHNKLPPEQKTDLLNGLKDQGGVSFGNLMMGFARAVILDSIIGLVIAFIMRNKRPEAAR